MCGQRALHVYRQYYKVEIGQSSNTSSSTALRHLTTLLTVRDQPSSHDDCNRQRENAKQPAIGHYNFEISEYAYPEYLIPTNLGVSEN